MEFEIFWALKDFFTVRSKEFGLESIGLSIKPGHYELYLVGDDNKIFEVTINEVKLKPTVQSDKE